MPTEVRSSLVVTAEAKGLDRVLRQTLGLNQSAVDGLKQQAAEYKKAQAEIKGLEDELKGLVKQQADLTRAMAETTEKGSKSYQQMETDLRKTRDRTKELTTAITAQERAYASEARAAKQVERVLDDINKQQREARGGLLQGIAQGLGVGEYLQRGPGMGRQIAGRMIGAGVRGAGGLAFGGIGGLGQAVSALPGGSFAAAGLQTAAGYAQQALQFQRQRLDISPFTGADPTQMGIARTQTARADRLRQQVTAQPHLMQRAEAFQRGGYQQMMQETASELRMANLGYGLENLEGVEPILETKAIGRGGTLTQTRFQGLRGAEGLPQIQRERLEAGIRARMEVMRGQRAETAEEMAAGMVTGRAGGLRERFEGAGLGAMREVTGRTDEQFERAKAAEAQAREQARRARDMAIGGPVEMGRRLRGLGPQEALQEAAQITQAGGGLMGGDRQFMGAAMAARTLFGVGPEVAGAFQMGARRGGLAGGREVGAGEALRRTLADAVSIGLNGAEITNYMQNVATGIQQFQQTGIPMEARSIGAMARGLGRGAGGLGLSATRAATVARGFGQLVQGVSARGPRSGLDVMLMQEFGGFTGGGGAEGLEEAYIQMERMGREVGERGIGGVVANEKMRNILSRLLKLRGGGAGGRLLMRDILGEAGIGLGAEETKILGTVIEEGREALTPREQRQIRRLQERRSRGPGGNVAAMQARARQRVAEAGPDLEQQALVQAKTLDAGAKLAKAVMNMEESAARNANAFANLAKGPINAVSEGMKTLSGYLEDLTKDTGLLDKFAGKIAGIVSG